MAKREKVYLKDVALWGEIDHSSSAEQFPETYAKLDSLTQFSNKKLSWKCYSGHSWQAQISNRSKGRGCPFCSGRRTSDTNRLSFNRPGLAREWDLDKNELTPFDVPVSSCKKAWWRCEKGHSWQATIKNRSKGRGCPFCSGHLVSGANRLSTNKPDIAREWDFGKNDLTPFDVPVSSRKKAWWKCPEGHSWQAAISSRSSGRGCPFCSGNLVSDANCLSTNRPEIAREWDLDKNELTPFDVTVYSNKSVWWECSEGHSWRAKIGDRSRGYGCPFCSGRLVSDANRLSLIRPDIASEWASDKNELTPFNVTVSSGKKVWWRCSDGHSWQATVDSRSRGNGCPKCATRTRKIEVRFIKTFNEGTDFLVTAHGMRLNQLKYESGRSGVEVDIILYHNNHYLLLEYDGSYWHRDKVESDFEKSRLLLSLGDNILHARIRENDLPDLDLVHNRFAQFRHAYHATEADSIESTVKDIEHWFLEKIGE